ncbi:HEAT repeat domain-containing protein [Streptosporangium soli]|nr:HEAT repeat domain-containing protein [Streptosporangium sp. KLBMP 9127]
MSGDPVVDSIERLVLTSAEGRRAAFDDLASALFGVVSDVRLAERALDVLTAAGPTVWIELDSALRPWLYGHRDPRITPAPAVRRMSNPLAVALAACSRDGRQREEGIRHPLMATDVRLLPVLVVRTVDWAAAVQRQALRVLSEVLSRSDAAVLQAVVPVAVRLGDRRRGNPATELVRQALLRADDDTLSAVRRCEDLRGRRFAFEVSLRAERMDRRQLAAAARHESDIISRTRCAEALAAQAVTGNQPELMEELLDAGSARVRVEALTTLVRFGRTDFGPRYLGDHASMVRLTAQWSVRRAGGDPAELYRRLLAAPADRGSRGLLAGLGDCGTRADAELVLPYLRDPRPRVRAEAVHTLRRLGAQIDVADLLEDPAPVVVRNVLTTLRAAGPNVLVERLWALLGDDHPRHVRQAAHRLLADRDAWTRVRADLLLAVDPDEALSLRARTDLSSWCAHDSSSIYSACPAGLRDELEDLLSTAEERVGVANARLLRWLIRTSG